MWRNEGRERLRVGERSSGMAVAEDVGVSSPPLRFLIVSEQLCQADGEIICLEFIVELYFFEFLITA